MLTPAQLVTKVGRKILFVGTEAYTWKVSDFQKCATNARSMGFDTICVKRADGGIKWYQTPGHLALERQACLGEGVGFIPFIYSYGPRFGDAQIDLEASLAKEMALVSDGLVCLDMEVEWNGQVAAAERLKGALQDIQGDIILSTWADPIQQNWIGVIAALKPIVSAWGPQQYTTWLATQDAQFLAQGITQESIFPAVDIADVYSYNDPQSIWKNAVASGHGSVWVWEYLTAIRNGAAIRSMMALATNVPAPNFVATQSRGPALPLPSHMSKQAHTLLTYTIAEGDTLVSIAGKLHIKNWYADLYAPNQRTLNATAQRYGHPDSNNGAIIYPGTVLLYILNATIQGA